MVTADSCGCRGTASFAEGNNAVLFSADVQRRFLSFLTSAAGYFFGSRRSDEQQRGGARWKAGTAAATQPSATGKADRSVVGPVHAVHLHIHEESRGRRRGVAVQVLLQGIVKIIAAILILTQPQPMYLRLRSAPTLLPSTPAASTLALSFHLVFNVFSLAPPPPPLPSLSSLLYPRYRITFSRGCKGDFEC